MQMYDTSPYIRYITVGFDLKEPTARQGGKPAAIASLRAKHPYATIAMVRGPVRCHGPG